MKFPRLDERRRRDLDAELVRRGRSWLPEWRPRATEADLAGALFAIAARIGSEVTQRLDRVPEKAFRGFLHWLGVRGEAARAARLPVVFVLTPGSEPVLAEAGIQVQAALEGQQPIFFETEEAVRLVPATLPTIVGVDAANDRFFLPPGGLSPLEPAKPSPGEWRVKSVAAADATQLQLEPELGLGDLAPEPGTAEGRVLVHERTGLQYRVTKVDGGIVDIDPRLGTAAEEGDRVRAVKTFRPFEAATRDRQVHAVYIGGESLLDIEGQAEIKVETSKAAFAPAVEWSYWGKRGTATVPGWQKLERKPGTASLILDKPIGAVDITSVGGVPSRWLRGVLSDVGEESPLRVGSVKLAVNCVEEPFACPSEERSTVPVEAITNSTPVVLNTTFYPLGPEPRQFDAFYLGSKEAFSKRNAEVRVCFEKEDSRSAGHGAALIGESGRSMLFAVGGDGNLHRLEARAGPQGAPLTRLPAIRPPFSDTGIAAGDRPPARLNVKQPARLSAVSRAPSAGTGNDAIVAVTAGQDVWLWRQAMEPALSRWYFAGPIAEAGKEPPPFKPDEPPSVLVSSDGAGLRLLAVSAGSLFTATLTAGWEESPSPARWFKIGNAPTGRAWLSAAPVFGTSGRLKGSAATDGFVAVSAEGLALATSVAAAPVWIDLRGPIDKVQTDVAPLVVRLGSRYLIVAQKTADEVRAWTLASTIPPVKKVATVEAAAVGSFDWMDIQGSGGVAVLFARKATGAREVVTWFPLASSSSAADPATLYGGLHLFGEQGAVTLGNNATLVAPGASTAILTATFDAAGLRDRSIPESALEDVVVFEAPNPHDPPCSAGDFLILERGGMADVITQLATDPERIEGDRTMFRAIPPFPGSLEGAVVHRREHGKDFQGTSLGSGKLELATGDRNARVDALLMVTRGSTIRKHRITEVNKPGGGASWNIKATPALNHAAGTTLEYAYVGAPASVERRVLPLVDIQRLDPDTGSALLGGRAFFKGAKPARQGTLYVHRPGGAAQYVVLSEPWDDVPQSTNGAYRLVVNQIFSATTEIPAPTPAVSARLSWEYWDGTSWWVIDGLEDGTRHLTQTGAVWFCVPERLEPTDVAGRTNHWIRARLVEGDYGRERVTVKTAPTSDGGTTQTVERSSADIAAPQIVWVDVRYSVCCLAIPDHVVTEDGGAFVNRSVANKTAAATVEVFMPLRETIARAARTAAGTAVEDLRTAVYLGFDAAFASGPISLLFLVEEGDHDEAFPLRVDALREVGFEPLTAVEDGTRGLNESGVLSFTLTAPPAAIDIFGRPGFWLRLRPRKEFEGTWDPRLRAVYLNATMASAAETQVEELLGSSDGAPNQTVFLARPPVLDNTLRLRVRERLAEEDVGELRRIGGQEEVRNDIGGRPGPWVLWRRVVDPLDEPAEARAYAFDEVSGAIRFGDGRHGRIPPIDTDSILAERYRRGGGDAANAVRAWSQVTLVTPVQGVERVVVPGGAAGGADAQDADAVVQFGPANQLMRGRALTLRDLEMTALQFSPDVAQVRALERGGRVRLVVAMRGAVRAPSGAVVRELRRHLLARALPSLGEKDALQIVAPRPVPVRVRLVLAIGDVEHSGAVMEQVDNRLGDLLHPATGGLDGAGWRLGDAVLPTDIAARLDGIEHLEGIDEIEIRLVRADGALAPLPAALPPDGLVELAALRVDVQVVAREHVA